MSVRTKAAKQGYKAAKAMPAKAYARSSDRSGNVDFGALLDDRKVRKQTAKSASALRDAFEVAGKKRKKPKPLGKIAALGILGVIAVVASMALSEGLRTRVLELVTGSSDDAASATAATTNGSAV